MGGELMYTNYDRLHMLEAVSASMGRYNGPIGIMLNSREGVDDDIWEALNEAKGLIDKRIEEVKGMDLGKEAV